MGFFDNMLAPFRRKAIPTEAVGVSGTPIFGGWIASPEKNPLLVGTKKFEKYSDIVANTAIVGAGVRLFLNLMAKPEWKVVPANDSDEAKALAEKVDFILHDMTQPWHSVVRTAARFRFYGFSIQEWTAKKLDDGSIGLLDIEARPQYTIEQWDTDKTGTVAGVIQRDPTSSRAIYLPRSKIVYLVDNSLTDSPEGVGLFRHIVGTAAHLSRLEQLEGFGFESDLAGIPVGRAPILALNKMVTAGTISAEQRDNMLKGLRNFVSNRIKNPSQGLLLDSQTYTDLSASQSPSGISQWGVEVLTGEGTSSVAAISAAIERMNREAARVLGVEHLMLGGDGAGSLALSRDKTSQFATLIEGTLNELAWSFEHDLLEPLRQLNGWDEALMPSLMPGSIQMRDVQDVAETLALLAQAGAPISPNDPAVNEVRAQLKISPVPETAMMADAALGAVPEPTMLGAPPPAADPGDAPGETDTGQESDAAMLAAGVGSTGKRRYPAAITRIAKASAHSGVMVALYPHPDVAKKLAALGTTTDEPHVTVAYLGKGLSPEQVSKCVDVVKAWAGKTPPIVGKFSGIGRFSGSSSSDGKDVVYASLDSHDLTKARPPLVDALDGAGVGPETSHGYTPHLTLSYVGQDEPTAIHRLDPIDHTFSHVAVQAGEERSANIPFGV